MKTFSFFLHLDVISRPDKKSILIYLTAIYEGMSDLKDIVMEEVNESSENETQVITFVIAVKPAFMLMHPQFRFFKVSHQFMIATALGLFNSIESVRGRRYLMAGHR